MSTSEFSQNTFRDGGEMGALMLTHDWSRSPLGEPGTWPSALRSTVGLMLGSAIPMFIAWGDELGFLYNDAYATLLGNKHPAALGGRFDEIWGEIWGDIYPMVHAALQGQSTYRENLPLVVKRKSYSENAWFTFSYCPVRDDNGRVVGMFCCSTETTPFVLSQRRADFRLALNERIREAVSSRDAINVGCALLGKKKNAAFCTFGEVENDVAGNVQSAWMAPGVASIIGTHRFDDYGVGRVADLLSGNPVLINDVRSDSRTSGSTAEQSYAAIGCRATLDVPLVRDGRVHALLSIGMPEPHYWTDEDVTLAKEALEIMWHSAERARAEAKLSESEERFRAMADNAPVIVWVTNAEGYCTYLNHAWYEFTGQTREAAEGFGWLNATHPDDQQMTNEIFGLAVAKHEPFRAEYRLRHADGTYRWAIDAAAPRFGDDGEFLGFIGSVIDIDERRKAEQRLIESEAKYRMLFDSIDEGFCIAEFVDGPGGELDDYLHVELNAAYVANAGIPDARGKSVRELIGEEAEEWIQIYRNVLLTGEPIRFERELIATNRYLELSAFRIEPPSKRQVAVLFKDVTARKIAEVELVELNEELSVRVENAVAQRAIALEHLHEAQKLETLGHLTGGVAHDFNNLLTPIVGAFDILSRRPDIDDRTRILIEGGAQASEKARVLVQRLLAFSRRQALENKPVDICRVVSGMTDLIARSIGPQIILRVDCATRDLVAFVDPNQFELALLNLAVNARDAMPDGGHLEISVNSVVARNKRNLPDGDYVRVQVKDTGAGMDEETLRRAIEPFFTTKILGQGTGLGLSSVHGLAAQSNGLFELASAVGQGTVANLWLPASTGAIENNNMLAPTGPASQVDRLSILLVDDEMLVRMGTAHMLQDIGHHVIEASSARQALQVIESGAHIDLLLTDYAMPDMSGDELALAARNLRPELKLLLVTGYVSTDKEWAIEMPRLEKPFGQDELAAAISKAGVTRTNA